jgi:hypothetical protein
MKLGIATSRKKGETPAFPADLNGLPNYTVNHKHAPDGIKDSLTRKLQPCV